METTAQSYLLRLVLVFIIAVPLKSVTVNPALCPTNKIAPHRRAAGRVPGESRTFGTFYDLLLPGNQQNPSSLQEQPQKDEPDDCGDIEDYDENDLSSLSQQSQRRQGFGLSRLFFSGYQNGQHPNGQHQIPSATRPPVRPQRPSYQPTRPPYWSGGYFGNNAYRPPLQQYPSNDIKPVHEGGQEPQIPYHPDVVGGPIGHVVGVSPVIPTRRPTPVERPTRRPPPEVRPTIRPTPAVRPTRRPASDVAPQRLPSYNNIRFPRRPTEEASVYDTTRPQPRQLNNNDSILGSFIDLLFK